MRVNDCAAHYLALSHKADHQGTLWYQPPKDSIRFRHFKLIGNLLFFYKAGSEPASSNTIEHLGLMLIEQCSIEKFGDHGQVEKVFFIMFNGEPDKKHYFTAPNVNECETWIEALNTASYDHLRMKLRRLRQEMQQASGVDPWVNIQKKVLAKLMLSRPVQPQLVTQRYRKEIQLKEKHNGEAKQKHKPKGGSTFYMDSLRKECKKNVHEVGVESAVQKSKFFTELDVIRTPDRREASGSSDYERTLSSRVTELRLKAKNVSLPKTQPVTSIQPSNVLMSASLDTGRSQARSSTYNDIIDTDLLDFTKPVTEPLPTEPITDHTTSASSHQARHPSVFGSEVPLFPQQNIASVHGQPLSLIPCASHIPDKSSSRSVDNTKQLLDFNTPITDNVSTQPPQHVASMFLTSDQSQQKCQNSVDLSFFENPLSQTNNTSVSCTSKRFTNWEKF